MKRKLHSNEEINMTIERGLRLLAGSIILVTVALGHLVSPYWYLFTAFVGLNLLQSAFTNWCPAMYVLRKLGLKGTSCVSDCKD
jgi:hypothetical protein